uniref:Uncharacterized protein n=2 Tax=Picea TaxID=3328 RepID=A0A117NGU5_PICGL|nr:hypothetical protein ABT39_MTgene5518 [Picea glauca]QHR91584.1 hypothetical protein Q903MT_gene5619 [Picea sitchensis]
MVTSRIGPCASNLIIKAYPTHSLHHAIPSCHPNPCTHDSFCQSHDEQASHLAHQTGYATESSMRNPATVSVLAYTLMLPL